jgi:DNA-binding transcriptional MerR regulator
MALMTTASAARAVGVGPGTLRLYDRLGLLSPQRDSDGRRLYSHTDLEKLRKIHSARVANRGTFGRKAR